MQMRIRFVGVDNGEFCVENVFHIWLQQRHIVRAEMCSCGVPDFGTPEEIEIIDPLSMRTALDCLTKDPFFFWPSHPQSDELRRRQQDLIEAFSSELLERSA